MVAVTQVEVESLYKRFRALDRGRKGYISGDEFHAIPELSINPICQVCRLCMPGALVQRLVTQLESSCQPREPVEV